MEFEGGKKRFVLAQSLRPFEDAVPAYALWKSFARAPTLSTILLVTKVVTKEGTYCWEWFGGFASMPAPSVTRVLVREVSDTVSNTDIRAMMWAEAISSQGLRNADIPRWLALIRRNLPDDLILQFFGARGLTSTSVARLWGLSRQTVSLHLRAAV